MTEPIYNLLALVITNGILGTLLFKGRRRKENAEADEAELNNDIKRTNWMEARIGERDKRWNIIIKNSGTNKRHTWKPSKSSTKRN